MCHEITYGTQQLEPALRDLVALLQECSKSKSGYSDEYAFSDMAQYIALAVKHPKYSKEREVRLIFQRGHDRTTRGDTDEQRGATLRYRARRADIVEYLDTPVAFSVPHSKDTIPKLPLCKVVVGPGAKFSKNIDSIRAVLLRNGFVGVDVVESQVPFKPR
jgi:hypothetical protein